MYRTSEKEGAEPPVTGHGRSEVGGYHGISRCYEFSQKVFLACKTQSTLFGRNPFNAFCRYTH